MEFPQLSVKNQRSLGELVYFVNRLNSGLTQIGNNFRKWFVLKFVLSKNVLQNYYFTIEINSRNIQMILMWKIDFDVQILALFNIYRTVIHFIHKIQ